MHPYLTVAIGSVALQFFGATYYGPLFGRTFQKCVASVKRPETNKPPAIAIGSAMIGAVLINMIVSMIVNLAHPQTAFEAVKLGWLLLLLVFGVDITHAFFEGKTIKMVVLHEVYHVIILTFLSLLHFHLQRF